MVTTRRACLGSSAAYKPSFFAFLGSRPRARLEQDFDELLLESIDCANAGTLRFHTQPMPSSNALEKFIHVSSTRVPCNGFCTIECLHVHESASEPWRVDHGQIIGFTPEPGIEYRLRVLKIRCRIRPRYLLQSAGFSDVDVQ